MQVSGSNSFSKSAVADDEYLINDNHPSAVPSPLNGERVRVRGEKRKMAR
jgi:hypothetical protein